VRAATASTRRERITITDHGVPAAVLVNAQELADLDDDLAIALYRGRAGDRHPEDRAEQ
jgi:PHD/YefM family antitoxin component YafN of YafNO toxin-antitoxin module